MNGFTEKRTVKVISIILAMFGMFSLLIQRVLTYAIELAHEALGMALARYGGATGRFASKFFAEDKKILTFVRDVQQMLPTFEVLLTILLVFSMLVIVIAVISFAFPKQLAHILVAMKILKWHPAPVIEETKTME